MRNHHGKGTTYVLGTFAGVDYSATVRRPDFDMTTDFKIIDLPELQESDVLLVE